MIVEEVWCVMAIYNVSLTLTLACVQNQRVFLCLQNLGSSCKVSKIVCSVTTDLHLAKDGDVPKNGGRVNQYVIAIGFHTSSIFI